MVATLRDTQNYVHLAAHGLTLWDVTPSRVERDLDQWAPLLAWCRRAVAERFVPETVAEAIEVVEGLSGLEGWIASLRP